MRLPTAINKGVIKMEKKNTYLYVKKTIKNGKEYNNLVCETTLNNGRVVSFEIKQTFFKRKFDYLLKQNLDIKGE